jgi:hypothetical protein
MERAIGEVKTSTTIYFDKLETDEFKSGSPIDITILRKVDITIESGSYSITNTFYLNEKDELQYYYYEEDGYECNSRSYYFNMKRCIQIEQDVLEDECIVIWIKKNLYKD